jgi:hypothetical protein
MQLSTYFVYNLTICVPWGEGGTKFILLARKVCGSKQDKRYDTTGLLSDK